MNTEIIIEYRKWLLELKARFLSARIKAAVNVNRELIHFYWSIGRDLMSKDFENTYGSGFFDRLSRDLRSSMPDARGFSPNNLRYMRAFFKLYSTKSPILQQVVGELHLDALTSIPWGHHIQIMTKCANDVDRAWFYVQKVIENNWSRNVLLNFLATDLYDREGNALTNFKATLPISESDLAQQVTKDPYSFNFLSLENSYREKELKDALLRNIQNFLLELGTGFAFVGREYRLNVAGSEQFIDLLFYHIKLKCYIVVEVKTGEFKSADLGQLSTYVVAVNHQLKEPEHNPTIGLLICKTKNNVLARYALEGSNLPMAISEYELEKLYPSNFKSSLPTIEELENELT